VVPHWGRTELSDVIDAMCMQYGVLGADAGDDSVTAAGDDTVTAGSLSSSSSSGGSKRKGNRGAASAGAMGAAAAADADRDRPAQQLLRALGVAIDPLATRLHSGDVAAAVRLMASLEVHPPAPLLERYCADVAGGWQLLTDGALVAAPAALANVGASAPSAQWLSDCADHVLERCVCVALLFCWLVVVSEMTP